MSSLDSIPSAVLNTPKQVGSITGIAKSRYLGLTHAWADRVYGGFALLGHTCMALSGKFTGNPYEIATGILWGSSSAAMFLFPGKNWTIKMVGATVITGSISLMLGSLHKDHHLGQMIFGSLAITRSAILLFDPSKFKSPTLKTIFKYKKELNGGIAAPSRLGLSIDAMLNGGQGWISLAAVLYQICDTSLIASGQTQKRDTLIQAALERGGR